jgi:predicted  nucleic acid-binding Zn-ribbon protein
MSDNMETIVLEHLRHIHNSVDQIADELSDLNRRMSSLEAAMVSVKHEVAHGDETDASQQVA